MNNIQSVFDNENMDSVSHVDFDKAGFLAKVNGLTFTMATGRFMVNGVEVCSKMSTDVVDGIFTGVELLSATMENVTAMANAIVTAANTTVTTVNSFAPYMQIISRTAYVVATLFYSNSPSSAEVSEAIAIIGGALSSFLKSEEKEISVVDTKTCHGNEPVSVTFDSCVAVPCSDNEDKDWEMVTVEPVPVSVAFASCDIAPCSVKEEEEDWELLDC